MVSQVTPRRRAVLPPGGNPPKRVHNGPPLFADLNTIVASMRGDLYARVMRKAQRMALIEWRDRKQAPGVAARMEESGKTFYNFSARSRPRKGKPYYVHSGGLRRMLLARKPKSAYQGAHRVVTRLKYGGGALNFLVDKRGTRSTTRSLTVATVTVAAHTRRAGTVQVTSYAQAKRIDRVIRNKAAHPYSAEFGQFQRDRVWIQQRTRELFVMLLRRLVVDPKTGGIKDNVLGRDGLVAA